MYAHHLTGAVDPPYASKDVGKRRRMGLLTMKVVAKTTFSFRQFSWTKLFATCAGYAFLFTAAHFVVRKLALYVLPEKRQYTDLMVEMSPDFLPEAPLLSTSDGP